jgi:nitronate monooxygenase
MAFSLAQLEEPIVQAPMAGGPSTPALSAAVAHGGGLPFLAAGGKTVDAVRADIDALRAETARPFGLNLFAPPSARAATATVERYAASLAAEAERYGTALGEPRHDDDEWEGKLGLLEHVRVAVVSFTFGCPSPDVLQHVRATGAIAWVTVTTPAEALAAARAGADGLVVQGVEAGGHRGSFEAHLPGDIGVLPLLQLVRDAVQLPLVAAGGIADGRGVAAVLAAGADAAQIGTALMLAAEAGTSATHRAALKDEGDTALTRAFTGRPARGIVNRFMREHSADAPTAYPDVHHLTAPLRAAAMAHDDADGVHLWAGQAHRLAREGGAEELVRTIAADARKALAEAAERHPVER